MKSTTKKPATKVAAKQATKVATKKATDVAGAKPKAPDAIHAFAGDFVADLPPEAAGGSYAPTINARWHGKTYKIADGNHALGAWTFTFAGGRFIDAKV